MARILAVDDDAEVLGSVKDILEHAGHNVSVTRGGEEALLMLGRQAFDLVVLDIIMPEMNGIEVCRQMRANPAMDRIPVLFLTAKGRQGCKQNLSVKEWTKSLKSGKAELLT